MQTVAYLGLLLLVAATNAYKITSDIESGMRRSGPPCPPGVSLYQCLMDMGKRASKEHCTQNSGETCTPSHTPVRPGSTRKCCRDSLVCYECGVCSFYDPCPIVPNPDTVIDLDDRSNSIYRFY